MVSVALIAGLVAEYALPWAGKALFGDKGEEVAEKVGKAAMAATGATTVEQAAEVLAADPEAVMRFKQGTHALENDLEKAYLADKQDARKLEAVRVNAGVHNYRADIMLGMAFLTVGALVTVAAVVEAIPEMVLGTILTLAGGFAKDIHSAFDFEFGSSRSSKEKDHASGRR